jgi:hypothetical protein
VHLKPTSTATFDGIADLRSSLWREIIDLDESLSLATGCPPGIPGSSINCVPKVGNTPLGLCAQAKRTSLQLGRIARDMLKEISWTNKKIFTYSERLEHNVRSLVAALARSQLDPVDKAVSGQAMSQVAITIPNINLRTHAYIMCLNCNAAYVPKRVRKRENTDGDTKRSTDFVSEPPVRRGNKAYERCYGSILKSARIVLLEFCSLYQLGPAAIAQDWILCHYAFTAAAILGIARYESVENLNIGNADYKQVEDTRLVFAQLLLGNPTSHLFQLAGSRLLLLLTDGGRANAGGGDINQAQRVNVLETDTMTPSSWVTGTQEVHDSQLTPHQHAGPEDVASSDPAERFPSATTPRKRPFIIKETRSRKRQKPAEPSSQRLSVHIPLSASSCAAYSLGTDSVPATPLINETNQCLRFPSAKATFNGGSSTNGSFSAGQNYFDPSFSPEPARGLEPVRGQFIHPPMPLGDADYAAMQEDLQLDTFNNYRRTKAAELSFSHSALPMSTLAHITSASAMIPSTALQLRMVPTPKHLELPHASPKMYQGQKSRKKRRSRKSVNVQQGFVNKTLDDWPELKPASTLPSSSNLEDVLLPESRLPPAGSTPSQTKKKGSCSASFRDIETPETIERKRSRSQLQQPAPVGVVASLPPKELETDLHIPLAGMEAAISPTDGPNSDASIIARITPCNGDLAHGFQLGRPAQPLLSNDSFIGQGSNNNGPVAPSDGFIENGIYLWDAGQLYEAWWEQGLALAENLPLPLDVSLDMNMNGVQQYHHHSIGQQAPYHDSVETETGPVRRGNWWAREGES